MHLLLQLFSTLHLSDLYTRFEKQSTARYLYRWMDKIVDSFQGALSKTTCVWKPSLCHSAIRLCFRGTNKATNPTIPLSSTHMLPTLLNDILSAWVLQINAACLPSHASCLSCCAFFIMYISIVICTHNVAR